MTEKTIVEGEPPGTSASPGRQMGFLSRWLRRTADEFQAQADANSGRYERSGSGIELVARAWGDAPRNVPEPVLVVNGVEHKARWGATFHPVPPGSIEVEAFHRFAWWRGSYARLVDVTVPDRGLMRLEYRAKFPAWRRGTLRPLADDEARRWRMGWRD